MQSKAKIHFKYFGKFAFQKNEVGSRRLSNFACSATSRICLSFNFDVANSVFALITYLLSNFRFSCTNWNHRSMEKNRATFWLLDNVEANLNQLIYCFRSFRSKCCNTSACPRPHMDFFYGFLCFFERWSWNID